MDLHDPRGQLHLDYLEAPLRYEEQRAAHLVARSDVIGSSVTHICYRYLEEAIFSVEEPAYFSQSAYPALWLAGRLCDPRLA
jgi:hypothetical protein